MKLNSSTEKTLQLTLFTFAIIGVAPFTITSELFKVEHIIFSIFYRTIFFLIALILLLNSDLKKLLKARHIQLFLLFFSLYFIRVLFDTLIMPKELGFPIEKYYSFTIGVVMIPALAFNFRLEKTELEKAFKIIVLIFFLICIYSLFVSNFQFENGSNRLWGGKTLHPIGLGHIAVTNIVISLYFFKGFKNKNILLIVSNIFISLITLSLTESRGPIVALFLMMIIYLFFIGGIEKNNKYLVVVIFFVLALLLSLFSEFNNRVAYTITNGGARLEHWRIATEQFISNPIWGSSLEENVNKIYPHNILIESFMALGIFGGIIFICLISIYFICGSKILKTGSKIDKLLVILFVQYFVSSMFSGSLIGNYLVWFLGFMMIYIRSFEKGRSELANDQDTNLC